MLRSYIAKSHITLSFPSCSAREYLVVNKGSSIGLSSLDMSFSVGAVSGSGLTF